MGKELTLDLVQSQMRPAQRLTISEETVQEIQKLSENPDYGQEFLDCYLDHLNVYKENPRRSHQQYLNAIKFFSLVESGNSLTDAYIKLFPHRYEDRKKNFPAEERDKSIMRGEASRYNSTMLVNEIRKVASIPIQLIHRHILHEAILDQAELMRNAKSEMVRQRAGQCLITELKPSEENTLNIKVDDNTTSVIEELRKASKELASGQYKSIMAGASLKEISASKLIKPEEIIEAEYTEDEGIEEDTPVKTGAEKWTL